ncbi:MAG: hypothetical protein P4L83_11945 [Nevskia sp.]|nr:hypothetical protein [Nevskia sp.]
MLSQPIRLQKPIPREFDQPPQTIGEHIKRARLLRGLKQSEAAKVFGANHFTIINWEKGRTEPPATSGPAILAFIGYDPYPAPQTLPGRMRAKRRAMGWSIREAARQFGVDAGTWGYWEGSAVVPWQRFADALELFLSNG